jgi:alpha 1,3-glucosidase
MFMKGMQLLILLLCLSTAAAVDRTKFRKCSDAKFCKQHRQKDEAAKRALKYRIESSDVKHIHDGWLQAPVLSSDGGAPLVFSLASYQSGALRFRITEEVERWEPPEILLNEGLIASSLEVLKIGDPRIPQSLGHDESVIICANTAPKGEAQSVVAVYLSPLRIELYVDGTLTISANSLNLLHFEQKQNSHSRNLAVDYANKVNPEDRHGGKEVVDYGEDGLAVYADGTREEKQTIVEVEVNADAEVEQRQLSEDWTESFGSHKDSKPEGPMSVGLDFTFHYASEVYGLPEHASSLALKNTIAPLDGGTGSSSANPAYSEPFRLYNLDVFEYELDEPMALYGHIPVMLGHGLVNEEKEVVGHTAGVFWFNPSETFVDISATSSAVGRHTHWMSETGNVDVFLFPGTSPAKVWSQYSAITGRQQLPPMFSLGYHQCRWNYRDERDVSSVESTFEDLDFPYDVLWLDIEHTDGKRYFTWDKNTFPTPLDMQKNISAHGRKMVTIVDPHIKRDDRYHIHKEATAKGLYIKDKHGKDFDGWCWPGQSSYLDFTNAEVRQWWAEQFSVDKYQGSTLDLFTWNDMNEPSVFNGPEVSMPKDCKSISGVDHRYWHNLYGLYMQRATAEGLSMRAHTPALRPFVLSRAFWAGSQRYGAIWTGDNSATWGHLKVASPMLLSIGLGGLSFAGADVGGFFGEPGAELFTRWYQAGSFTPFFRGHAHHDTKRREPWAYGSPHTEIHRTVAMTRYSLLPYWYSTFYDSYTTGMPVMRPLFAEYPDDSRVFAMDDQWLVGSDILVKPVTDAGKVEVDVFFPGKHGWYDFHSLAAVDIAQSGYLTVAAPLDTIPVFLRGGSIVPKKMRLRRSSKLMYFDPYTLVVSPDQSSSTRKSSGMLYLDDETTLAHEQSGAYAVRRFDYEVDGTTAVLKSTAGVGKTTHGIIEGDAYFLSPNKVERVTIAGQVAAPISVSVKPTGGQDQPFRELDFVFKADLGTLIVKNPDVLVSSDWEIVMKY